MTSELRQGRIGLCPNPEHAQFAEFYVALDGIESRTCPACTRTLIEYVAVDAHVLVTDAEFRQALCLSAYDALTNTERPHSRALEVLEDLMHRLARSEPFTVQEEGLWLSLLMDAGWELTASFDPEKWKPLTDAP